MTTVKRFLHRHKVALIGLVFGTIVLLFVQTLSGSGDYTFEQSSTAPVQEGASIITLEGPREVDLILPSTYQADVASPLLINLHGYSGSGASQSAYTYLQEASLVAGLAYLAPTGNEDSLGSNFWNASSACCDFNQSKVDDLAYINSLIESASKAANIDTSRIYLFGHSNGHFMSYAFLCSGSTRIAAIAGLAGAMETDPSLCKASPNNVLHIHGQRDETILFNGGALFGNTYTSAESTINQWRAINGCATKGKSEFDLLASIEGVDANVSRYSCQVGSVELWEMPKGTHTPTLDIGFANQVIDWLLQFKSNS